MNRLAIYKEPWEAWAILVCGCVFLGGGLLNLFTNADEPGWYLMFFLVAILPTLMGIASLLEIRRSAR